MTVKELIKYLSQLDQDEIACIPYHDWDDETTLEEISNIESSTDTYYDKDNNTIKDVKVVTVAY